MHLRELLQPTGKSCDRGTRTDGGRRLQCRRVAQLDPPHSPLGHRRCSSLHRAGTTVRPPCLWRSASSLSSTPWRRSLLASCSCSSRPLSPPPWASCCIGGELRCLAARQRGTRACGALRARTAAHRPGRAATCRVDHARQPPECCAGRCAGARTGPGAGRHWRKSRYPPLDGSAVLVARSPPRLTARGAASAVISSPLA